MLGRILVEIRATLRRLAYHHHSGKMLAKIFSREPMLYNAVAKRIAAF
jgi:hypothetical protein